LISLLADSESRLIASVDKTFLRNFSILLDHIVHGGQPFGINLPVKIKLYCEITMSVTQP